MTAIQEFSFQYSFKCMFHSEIYKSLNDSVIVTAIPNISLGVTEQPTAIRPLKIPGNSVDLGEVAIDFILDQDFTNWRTIFNWMNTLQNFSELSAEEAVCDISVSILDNKFNYVLSIVYEDCFPTNITEIPFDVQADDSTPQTFTVMFTVNNMKVD